MTTKELQQAILKDKEKGIPDIEIGKKYGVTYREIERVITRLHGVNISTLKKEKKITSLAPNEFKEEQNTVWSFKKRGNWATHSGHYRGNWSPYIPRNVILKYSKPGELVLDYFCGAGTTAVEAKLLGRRCLALDINENAIALAKQNIDFSMDIQQLNFLKETDHLEIYDPELRIGDARNLSFLNDNSIDLICAHPPYANIIHYTDSGNGDLSFFEIDSFLNEMKKVASESFRVLKPGRQCAILIGDTRKQKYVVPLGFALINVYLDAGFRLRELVIKRQHNCKTTGFWYNNSIKYNFLLLAHEYLQIFEKPQAKEQTKDTRSDLKPKEITPIEITASGKNSSNLETTTVWIFPEDNFEKQLDDNVIGRYSQGKEKDLLYLKSTALDEISSPLMLEDYLMQIENHIVKALPSMSQGTFVVIQTQDIRIGEYVEPLAKRLIDALKSLDLRLKEIVVVTSNGANKNGITLKDHLAINHKYLLIYETQNESR
ncbi:methyltransferase domain-containing protein [bacterium]|nr:methyltransferase domain-containing protein [bacterium]